MKNRNSYSRSTRQIRAAYIAKNCPQSFGTFSGKSATDGLLGGVSFGALLIGLVLLLLV